jgi:hypothetical protein
MRLWFSNPRRKAIAIAEAHLRNAGIGEPEFKDAEYVLAANAAASTMRHLRSRGSSDFVLKTMEAHLVLNPPPTGWRVTYYVRANRHAVDFRLAIVTIDAKNGAVHLNVSH